MQQDVDHILAVAAGVSGLTAATGRIFRETDRYPIALVAGRSFENPEAANTQTTFYDGFWNYQVHLYGQATPEKEANFDDYSDLQTIATDFLTALLADAQWELAGISYDAATLAGQEIIVCQIEVRKFQTMRFI